MNINNVEFYVFNGVTISGKKMNCNYLSKKCFRLDEIFVTFQIERTLMFFFFSTMQGASVKVIN